MLFVAFSLTNAQTGTVAQNEDTQSPTKLIEATQQYKTSTGELLSLQEAEFNKAVAKLDELRVLVSDGLVAKAELEISEQSLAELRAQLEAIQKQIADSDHLIAEIQTAQELAKTQAKLPVKLTSKSYGTFQSGSTVLRFNGAAPWSTGRLAELQSFFSTTFGHALPTSAVGQSATHNRLGYDHRNAIDVALHPDSVQGKILIDHLQSRGIPFLAFRAAIPRVATGPHIHIGSPSHRL